jgi:2-polyprenyl-6-methoxyphenol hydroxylase-like FAD-dependent oxidoreductase
VVDCLTTYILMEEAPTTSSLQAIDLEMPKVQVAIVGAGVAGLVLGRCLLRHRIPFTLYERDTAEAARKRYNYGIKLHSSAYRPLLHFLDLDEATFIRRTAVDSAVGGYGREAPISKQQAETHATAFRAHRQRLESLLSEGLDVEYASKLVKLRPNEQHHALQFADGREAACPLVVGADGPHSLVRGLSMPDHQLEVLPYAVYNGKCRLDRKMFYEKFAPQLDGANVLVHQTGGRRMQINIDDILSDTVAVSYIYSRRAEPGDPIFDPSRPNPGARDIPEAFFDEIAKIDGLAGIFAEVFDADKMRKHRLLNWLMRSLPMDGSLRDSLEKTVEQNTILLGDAVHTTPILGSYGANIAIEDSIQLAEHLLQKGTSSLVDFYDSRLEVWRQDGHRCVEELAAMHHADSAHL